MNSPKQGDYCHLTRFGLGEAAAQEFAKQGVRIVLACIYLPQKIGYLRCSSLRLIA